ncbi:MAG: T9SS type A sorting domain-containing protein [Bacteroidetes bacterium]|nr:T9SS type A sorting domain-containing protein [Bacteroidota bacterium]
MRKIFTFLFFAIIGLNNIDAATFVSKATGNWNSATTWSITAGTDADGIPDLDDNVTISGTHTISIVSAAEAAKSILNNGTLKGNGKKLNLYGNFNNNSNVSGLVLYIQGTCVFSSSVLFNGATSWWIYKNLTINAGTSISTQANMSINSATVTNLGSVNISVNGGLSMNAAAKWINGAASTLTLSANSTTTGVLDASTAGNTVTYTNPATQIKTSTYYDLVLNGTSTKALVADNVILNNLTLNTGSTNKLNMNNKNLSIAGNWINNSNNSVLNQGTITFNGSGTQTITRTANESFKDMIIANTGTVLLTNNIDVTSSLTFNSGTLDLSASNYTLNLAGNLIYNAGTISQRGVINFNGTTAQTISGSGSLHFYNVRSANSNASGVLATSNVFIDNVLTVPSGKFGTSGSGVITIPATGATTYGRIGAVGGSLVGTGWKVESYINGPAPKGWQWLSSPINGNILKDWDDDPRFYMSGVGGNDGTAGTFKSVRVYTEATGAYSNITTINTPLTAGKGFQVWMADNNTTGLTAPLVYNSIGTPNFGTITFPITAGGSGNGYNLVGNPYACPITYSTVVATSGNLYSSFVILLENNTYSTDPNGGIIAPNQGFMCVAAASGNISFTEVAKNIVTNPNILKSATKPNTLIFSVYNNVNGLGGQTNLEFSKNATDLFEKEQDLPFLISPSDEVDNIWTRSTDNKDLLKNVLYSTNEDKQVPLIVKSGAYGIHHISVKGLSSVTNYNSIWLEDPSTGKTVDLTKEQGYDFNASEIGKEYTFVIHFSNNKKTSNIKDAVTSNSLSENTSVYNTPSNVVVKFDMTESTPVKISVYSLTGQQVIEPLNVNVTNDRIALPLQKENGLYLLIITSKDQQITRKIIY